MRGNGTWLCPTEADRTRLREASERVRRARGIAAGACAAAILVTAPWNGWWTLGLLLVALIQMATLDARVRRSQRPEYHVVGSLLSTELIIAVGVAAAGDPRNAMLPLLVLPVGLAAARFSGHVVVICVVAGALITLAATVGVDAASVVAEPTSTVVTLCLMVGVAAITSALQGAELEHRTASALDELTGLLNRTTLETRFQEIAEQARLTGGSVALVAFDLDNFKRINDRYGHERGDAVLRETAYATRARLRAFELLYRLGGEEFLLVMPGASLVGGLTTAELLRQGLSDAKPGGLSITASFGVSSATAEDVDFTKLFREADAALYAAKQAGRNQVAPLVQPASLTARTSRTPPAEVPVSPRSQPAAF